MKQRILAVLQLTCLFCFQYLQATTVDVFVSDRSAMIQIALQKLETRITHTQFSLDALQVADKNSTQLVLMNKDKDNDWINRLNLSLDDLKPEGFQIINRTNRTYVVGYDQIGLMYGILDLRDQNLYHQVGTNFRSKTENPHFAFRAVKFNLPWSSYRIGESLFLHMRTVRDTVFWEGYLDMMVDNRFNALTLWNLHPFTFMIQPENYPEAIQFTGQEFRDWQLFWRTLFRMAKERGIETYIINWNIITSPGMTETHDVANYKDDLEWHYGFTPADTSSIIVDYMRACITQTINEYPDLTGLGVSIGERMQMPMEDAMKWVKSTFVEGIKQANRQVKFIHRAPFKVEPEIARQYIESYTDILNPIIMEFKFNWSHAHSTPHLAITHGGKIADQYWNPKPSNYRMAWMMRNEDFIMLNWGNTEFIRQHIDVNDIDDVVTGYFVGSETYIPAKEFRMSPEIEYSWKYAYEKDWSFYQMWGRLLYNPDLPDSFFIQRFEYRYGKDVGESLFEAMQLGSRMPLALASFYQGTWDFTLYCEGFLNGGQIYRNYKGAGDAFIQIDEMITHPTLDSRYLNIDEFVSRKITGVEISEEEVTPIALANEMERNGKRIYALCEEIEQMSLENDGNLEVEVNDVRSWANLSLYFADKLRAGVYFDEAMKTKDLGLKNKAVVQLENAARHWLDLIESTQQYQEVTLLHIRNFKFSWEMYYPRVLKDIEIVKDQGF